MRWWGCFPRGKALHTAGLSRTSGENAVAESPHFREPTRRLFKESEYGSAMRQVGTALSIPGLLLAGPLVGYGLGWAAKTYLGMPKWVTMVCLVLGLISGIRESIIVIKKISVATEEPSDDSEE
jgi:F0F1-type ATP synthase assembly protein I